MKKVFVLFLSVLMLLCCLSGCGSQQAPVTTAAPTTTAAPETTETEPEQTEAPALQDGVYTAEFDTDSSMFHLNEVCEGKVTLTVENGQMTAHIILPSKKIETLFFGLAEDAQKDGAELIQPTVDSVTYRDGITEEVYGFDIPVPYLDEEFNIAIVGTKGNWYDHKVSVTNPVPAEN